MSGVYVYNLALSKLSAGDRRIKMHLDIISEVSRGRSFSQVRSCTHLILMTSFGKSIKT